MSKIDRNINRVRKLLRYIKGEGISISYNKKQDVWIATLCNGKSNKKTTLIHSVFTNMFGKVVEFLEFKYADDEKGMEKFEEIDTPDDYIAYLENKLESKHDSDKEINRLEQENKELAKKVEKLKKQTEEEKERANIHKKWKQVFAEQVGMQRFNQINKIVRSEMENV